MTFLIYIILLFISESEVEMCSPAFPLMQKMFNLTESQVEWVFGINVLFHCIAAIWAGSFGDRYGKSKITLLGFVILFAGNILASISNSYEMLLFARAIQGIGMAAPAVLLYPMFMESVEDDKNKLQKIGFFNAAFAITIALAPTIGSYGTLAFGWKGTFYIMLILSLLACFLLKLLKYKDRIIESKVNHLSDYIPLLKSPKVILSVIFVSVTIYIPYITMLPLVFINEYGVSQEIYGLYAGIGALIWGTLSALLSTIIKFFGKEKAVKYSLYILSFSILPMFIISVVPNIANPISIMMSFWLFVVGIVVPGNIFFIYSLSIIPNTSGKISTLHVNVKWISGIIATQIASHYYTHNFTSTGLVICAILVIILISAFTLIKIDKASLFSV